MFKELIWDTIGVYIEWLSLKDRQSVLVPNKTMAGFMCAMSTLKTAVKWIVKEARGIGFLLILHAASLVASVAAVMFLVIKDLLRLAFVDFAPRKMQSSDHPSSICISLLIQ
ncbi:hypothetical protein Acr_11g0009740 [Actinidia rufa]|uniref:Uncharacterized protein n=1 Tax=Actinidia rufa TaxID=165716 RepID=A0A7J0FDD5_9ERIC|nr:hypothetical protein Acr_11g0009740 [Actinidia rufa]